MTVETEPEAFTCPDCGFTAPLAGGLISFHEPDEDDFDPEDTE